MKQFTKSLFIVLSVLFSFSYAFAETGSETEKNATGGGSSNAQVNGQSYFVAGTYIAGTGSAQTGNMTSKGFKLRTGADGNRAVFSVQPGYTITKLSLEGASNYAKKDGAETNTKVIKVEVDDVEVAYTGGEDFQYRGESGAQSCNLTIDNIQATSTIAIYFDNNGSTGTQLNASWAINWERPDATQPTITLTPKAVALVPGASFKLTARVDPSSFTTGWATDAPAVATVAEDGTVTAVAAGVANITHQWSDDATVADTAVITVADFDAEKYNIVKQYDFTTMGDITLTIEETAAGNIWNEGNNKPNAVFFCTNEGLEDIAVQAILSSGKGWSITSAGLLLGSSAGRCAAIGHLKAGQVVEIIYTGSEFYTGSKEDPIRKDDGAVKTALNEGVGRAIYKMEEDGLFGFEITKGKAIEKIIVYEEPEGPDAEIVTVDDKQYKVVGENIITNGSFDDGVAGWYAGAWAAANADNYTLATEGGFDGGAYLQYSAGGVGSDKNIRGKWNVEIGKTYLFRCYTSGQKPTDGNLQYSVLRIYDESLANYEGAVLYQLKWGDADVWTENNFVFTATSNAVTFRSSWTENTKLDGFMLVEVERYFSPEGYNTALETAQNTLADENYAVVTGEERTTLANTIETYTNATADKYQEAIEALDAATNAFIAAAPAYQALADAKFDIQMVGYDVRFPYATEAKKGAAQATLNAVAKTAAEATTMTAAIYKAYRQFAESHAMAEGVEGAVNMTDAITNPKAESAIAEPWKVVLGAGSGGSLDIKSNEPWTDGDDNSTHKYFDGGNWGANAWDVSLKQDITLPAGKYMMTVKSRASDGVMFSLFAANDTTGMPALGASGCLFNRGWNDTSLEFEVKEAGTVNIGVQGVADTNHQWMSFSDFRLVQLEATVPEFQPAYGTLWTEEQGSQVDENEFNYITLENKYFNGLVKEGDTIKVAISHVGNQPSSRARIITEGTLNLTIDNAGESKTIQQDMTSADLVLDADEIANIQNGANVVLSWKNMTVAQVDLVEHKAEIDETLLAEAEQLASDESAVAVGKLLAAIEAYKKDGVKKALEDAMAQFKADNADQVADQTAKVATNGWKKFDGSNAGVCATQFAPAITTYDGRNAQLAESYEEGETAINRTGTIIYQDITGLTNGKYKVGFYGNAFFTSGRGFDSTMEDGADDVAYVFANDQKEFITARVATSTTENNFRQFDVEVTDGTIKLGMGKDKPGTNWHTMQIYQLTWFTTAKELFAAAQVELKASIEAAEALKTGNRTEGLDAFNDAIALAKQGVESNWYNITEIQSMISGLKDAMETFKVANYYKFNDNLVAYVIDAETGKSIAAGHDWGTRGIVNEAGLDLTFETTDNNKVFLNTQVSNGGNSHYLGDNLYMDGAAYAWAFEYVGFGFYITNGTQYVSLDAEDNLVLSDTPREWIVVTAEGVKETRLAEMADATPENPADATFLLQNPNFNRNDQRVAAWVVSDDCTNKNLNGGNNVNNCAESYHSTFTISQTITDAPKGTYELRAQGFYRQDNDATEDAPVFFINDKTTEVPVKTGEEGSMSAASESFTAGLYNCEPVAVFVENGTLTVGVKATGANQWVIFDNFRLTYYGSQNTVGISEVNNNVLNNVKTIYNLNGQKVQKAQKGLYIINGKKTVVK